jgi:hypothetical protein
MRFHRCSGFFLLGHLRIDDALGLGLRWEGGLGQISRLHARVLLTDLAQIEQVVDLAASNAPAAAPSKLGIKHLRGVDSGRGQDRITRNSVAAAS